MIYIVEIGMSGAELFAGIRQIRTWLAHMRCEPGVCRVSQRSDRVAVRVDFAAEPDARAFARAFGGQLLDAIAA